MLEHPAGSGAWPAFGLRPPVVGCWSRGLFRPDEWATEVWQGAYGHEAPKRTWLLHVGAYPGALDWRQVDPGGRIELMPSSGPRRRRTPPAFAELLISLAERCNGASLRSDA